MTVQEAIKELKYIIRTKYKIKIFSSHVKRDSFDKAHSAAYYLGANMKDTFIVCHPKLKGMKLLFSLSHEVGHHMDLYYSSKNYKNKAHVERRKSQCLDKVTNEVLIQELKAWENGEKLLKTIGFNIFDKRYLKYKHKKVLSYLNNML
jgi:hypothetical protein